MRNSTNKRLRQTLPFAVFLLAYLGYAAVQVLSDGNETTVAQLALVVLLGVMVLAIFWHARHQDEVHQAIARQANGVGFWGTFLTLYLVSTIDGFGSALQDLLPLWAVPLATWLVGYLWTIMRYR